MGPVEYPSLAKQANTDTRAFAFTQLSAKLDEQRFDVGPVDVAAGWSGKYQFQRLLVSTFHIRIVPRSSTVSRNGVTVSPPALTVCAAQRRAAGRRTSRTAPQSMRLHRARRPSAVKAMGLDCPARNAAAASRAMARSCSRDAVNCCCHCSSSARISSAVSPKMSSNGVVGAGRD